MFHVFIKSPPFVNCIPKAFHVDLENDSDAGDAIRHVLTAICKLIRCQTLSFYFVNSIHRQMRCAISTSQLIQGRVIPNDKVLIELFQLNFHYLLFRSCYVIFILSSQFYLLIFWGGIKIQFAIQLIVTFFSL